MTPKKKTVKKARTADSIMDAVHRKREQRRGPRLDKWRAELEALLKQLPKLKPGSKEFNAGYCRIMQLTPLTNISRYSERLEWITSMIAPELQAKAKELEAALKEESRSVSVITSASLFANGWFPNVYAHINPDSELLSHVTADSLPGQVAEVLRREAKALNAMADRIERKPSRKAVA